jgi:hypothetical protein
MIHCVIGKNTMNWVDYDVEVEFHAMQSNWKREFLDSSLATYLYFLILINLLDVLHFKEHRNVGDERV